MSFRIKLNGVDEFLPVRMTISELLKSKELNPARVVVEVNKNIVKRENYGDFFINDGDCIEVLRFVGGG